MVELIVLFSFVLVFLVAGGVYLSDRPGWNRTLGRVSRNIRASVEAKKAVGGTLEHRAEAQKALAVAWESEFTGKSLSAIEEKHKIVKHDFFTTSLGSEWPRWTCKCGKTGHTPAGVWGFDETVRKTATKGAQHVREYNKMEAMKASTNNQFMF